MKSGTGIAIVVLLALSGATALAHHGRVQEHLLKAERVSYGRYSGTGGGFIRTAAHATVRADDRLLETTDRIPLRIGERFGFCFEVTGFLEDGEIDLQKIVTHPSVQSGERKFEGFVQEVELQVVGGKTTGCIGHSLEGERDLITGRWIITLGAGETTLAEQSFEVR